MASSKIPFGKYKGASLILINSGYLKWLVGEEWFHDEYPDLTDEVEEILQTRTYENCHFYVDIIQKTK